MIYGDETLVIFIISGKNATGKSEICKYLFEKYNFEIIEIRGLLRELFPNNPNFAQKLYSTKKEGVLEAVLPSILKKTSIDKNIIIEGILSPQEITLLKRHIPNFYLIYFDSNKDIRLERIVLRTKIKNKSKIDTPQGQIEKSDKFRIKVMGIEELKTVANLVVINNSNQKPDFYAATESGIKRMFIKKITNILNTRIKSKTNPKLRTRHLPIKIKPR